MILETPSSPEPFRDKSHMVPWVSLFPAHFKLLRKRRIKAENHETRCGVKQLGGFRSEKLGGKAEVRVGIK